MKCPHSQTGFFKHLFSTSVGGYHIAEHCLACGANVRGKGQWVGAQELADLSLNKDDFPIWQANFRIEQRPGLFD